MPSSRRIWIFIAGGALLLVGSIIYFSLNGAKPYENIDPTRTPFPVCDEQGTVIRERIDSPTQGWPVRFEYYLPPCYQKHEDARYPVVYLIPGNGSSFKAWNGQGNAAEIADNMIRQGSIEPFILVTTGNYPHDPEGKIFLDDLFPYIDEHLRTKQGPRYRVVGGASLGGIIGYRMAFKHPEIIGNLGMFGCGIIHGEEQRFISWLDDISPEQMPRVLIDIGEDDILMKQTAQVLMGIFDERDIPYIYNEEPGDHSINYWSGNLEMYLQWFAEDW